MIATVAVVGGMFAYARWVCRSISKSRLVVGAHSFTIVALQKFRVHECEFVFDRTKCVIVGLPLSTLESLLANLEQLGMSRDSIAMNVEIKAGQLFVYDINYQRTAFQFLDKAFAEADLIRFIAALSLHGVLIEVGT